MRYSAWSYNGLTFGENTNIVVVESIGFDDMPPIRNSDVFKSNSHGAFAGLDLMDERSMTITLALFGSDRTSYDGLVQQVGAAFSPQVSELPLMCGDSGNRLIYCRPRKLVLPRPQTNHGVFVVNGEVELAATDPRFYDANLTSPTTGLSATSGGMTFNATFPVGFGSAGVGGTITVTNAGLWPTDWTATIAGPCINPVIDNMTTGQTMQLAITLGVGDSLVLSSFPKTIILNGTASRIYTIQPGSTWWTFPPGATLLRFRNNGAYDPSAQLTVSFRSAWLVLASGGA